MSQIRTLARLPLALALLLTMAAPTQAAKGPGYQAGFARWRAADGGFAGWTRGDGTPAGGGALQISAATATPGADPYAPGSYYGGNYYNGGSFVVDDLTSPEVTTSFGFSEAIASWNADTPAGTWIETQIRAKLGDRWTKWYSLGIWASYTSPDFARHSVKLQGDSDGYVAVDTLVISAKKLTASAFQLKLRLFSAGGSATPTVGNVSLAYSTTPPKSGTTSAGSSSNWSTLLNVPECSQMVYPDGGEVWCSPTSTSMVLGYWGIDPGPCEPRVRAAVEGVYDRIYDGHGNWPFNTAYAATKGMEGYVARFTSLAQAEPWVKAGVPVIMSIAWKKGELTNSTIPSTNGHLLVLVGFDAQGNPIVNDPAASDDPYVQVTYQRSEFEPLWQSASGGTVYLIYPAGMTTPAL